MDNKKIYNIVLLTIFLILLYAPTISYFFLKDIITFKNYENRELAQKPEFSFKNLKNYSQKFDLYYNDNLPYRSIIVNNLRTTYFNIFNQSMDDRIIIGKNESDEIWLFYDNIKDHDEISYIDGRKKIEIKKINDISKMMKNQIEKLKNKNIDLYYVVIPNKSSVYYEYLPKNIKIGDDYFSKVYEIMKNDGINNIYYNLDLLKKSKEKYETYCRTDTHWTDYGAYVYVKDLINNIYNEKIYDEEEIIEEFVDSYGRDLHNFFGVSFKIKDTVTTINYSNKVNIQPEKIKKSYGTIEVYNNDNYKLDETILIIGDSFTNRSTKFFSSIYKKVVRIYLNNTQYDSSILDEYRPNKIFYMRNERFTPDSLSIKFVK